MLRFMTKLFLGLGLLMAQGTLTHVLGQTEAAPAAAATTANPTDVISLWLMVLICLIVLVVAMMIVMIGLVLDYYMRLRFGHGLFTQFAAHSPGFLRWSWWTGLRPAAGASTPMDQPLGHDYDGIEELDNAAPPIFNYILVGTVLFAVGYLLIFHVFSSAPLQKEEFAQELKSYQVRRAELAKLAKNSVDETSVVVLTGAEDIATGKTIYTQKCVVCHGAEGQGGVGPNFADKYWIHGPKVNDLFRIIKKGGRPGKGMISWEQELTPGQMAQVASYILTFQGSTPPNPKAPEGDLYEASGAAPADSTQPAPADKAAALSLK